MSRWVQGHQNGPDSEEVRETYDIVMTDVDLETVTGFWDEGRNWEPKNTGNS